MGIFDKLKGKPKDDKPLSKDAKGKKETGKVKKDKKAGKEKKEKKGKKVAKKDTKKIKREIKPGSRAYCVLRRAMITEKGTWLNAESKYLFEVEINASKTDISKAVEDIYGVKPLKVNVIRQSGKKRSYGRSKGMTSDRKKAVVTLPEGTTIQVHEGV